MIPETDEVILNQDGEPTDVAAPADFGKGLAFLNPDQMPDLEEAEVGINITPESIEFKNPGESIRAVFNGFTFLKVKDQLNAGEYVSRQAAVLQTKTGIKINMGANLLKQLAIIPVGTAVQIEYKGEEKTNRGNKVKVYEVHLLNVPRVNIPIAVSAPQIQAPKVAPESVNQETGNVSDDIQLIDPMSFDAVQFAAKEWNVDARNAARQIALLHLGNRVEKAEFIQIVKQEAVAETSFE